MVDRITPRTTEALETEIATYWVHNAQSPVHAAAFIKWVLEDRFASDFPDLSKVGVEIVADVVPYEETKIRILNGGHTGLAYLGALAGHETFDQAMQDQEIRAHFDAWERDEVLIGLDKNMRDKFKDSEHFEDCAEFCEIYDQNSFDPAYDNMPIEHFEPMVRRVFAKPRKSIYKKESK